MLSVIAMCLNLNGFVWSCVACGCGWFVMLTVMRADIVLYKAMDNSKKAFFITIYLVKFSVLVRSTMFGIYRCVDISGQIRIISFLLEFKSDLFIIPRQLKYGQWNYYSRIRTKHLIIQHTSVLKSLYTSSVVCIKLWWNDVKINLNSNSI